MSKMKTNSASKHLLNIRNQAYEMHSYTKDDFVKHVRVHYTYMHANEK